MKDATSFLTTTDAVNTGLVLGNPQFSKEMERISGRRLIPLKRGPKSKVRPDGDRKQGFLP